LPANPSLLQFQAVKKAVVEQIMFLPVSVSEIALPQIFANLQQKLVLLLFQPKKLSEGIRLHTTALGDLFSISKPLIAFIIISYF
jgi:hypothetical protein